MPNDRVNGHRQDERNRLPIIGMPPHLVVADAEAAVLGGVLLRGSEAYADVAAIITAEDMWSPANSATLRAMARLHDRGQSIEIVGLASQLQVTGELELVGNIEGLARLDQHSTAHNIKAHAEIVLHASQLRETYRWHTEQAEAIRRREELTDDGEWDSFIGQARVRFAELTSTGARGAEVIPSGDVVERMIERMENAALGLEPCASLGFNALDDQAEPHQGDLVGVIARSGAGKTAFALSQTIGLTLARTPNGWWVQRPDACPVLWASAEMSNEDLATRMTSILADINGKALSTRKRGRSPDDLKRDFDRIRSRVTMAGRLIDNAPISFVKDSDARTLEGIVASTRKWKAEIDAMPADPNRGVPVLFVDYLTLLSVHGSWSREDLKWAHVTKTLTHLAGELGIVIVLLAQVNKKSAARQDGRCQIEDIREAGQLEHDAAIVLGIYRPAFAKNEIAELVSIIRNIGSRRANLSAGERDEVLTAEAKLSEAYIDVLKARNGELGPVPAKFIGRCTRFEIPDQPAT